MSDGAHPAATGEPGEFERIRRYFAPLAGPGGLDLLDDAAVVDCRAGQSLVMTADAIVEGVHYLPDDPPEMVAKKLLRVNLSDLAAMGARPLHYLLTTALPARCGADWLGRFAQGLEDDQRHFGVTLLGGDSVATSGVPVLSLIAIGEVAKGGEIRRSGARLGDTIWVSGTIGDASLGLKVLRREYPALVAEHRAALIDRFRVPEPRVTLGPALRGIAHAMIDVSDGLLADLGHICETSGVGAVVELAALPLSAAARAAVELDPELMPGLAGGGDDYELLFTAPNDATPRLIELARRLGVPLGAIGRIECGAGVRLVDAAGQAIGVATAGYRHF
jgi:thiamine-monophosphate kinase